MSMLYVSPSLYAAALVADTIFCMHGGLSPDLHSLSEVLYSMTLQISDPNAKCPCVSLFVLLQVQDVARPLEVPDEGLVCDLLWSDPDEVS